MELKKDSCCCGATKSKPCACMYEGIMSCSAKTPMCACYKELAAKKGAEIMMKRLKNSNKSIRDKSYNGFEAESFEAERGCYPCPDCGTMMYENSYVGYGVHCSCSKCGSHYITKPLVDNSFEAESFEAKSTPAYKRFMETLEDVYYNSTSKIYGMDGYKGELDREDVRKLYHINQSAIANPLLVNPNIPVKSKSIQDNFNGLFYKWDRDLDFDSYKAHRKAIMQYGTENGAENISVNEGIILFNGNKYIYKKPKANLSYADYFFFSKFDGNSQGAETFNVEFNEWADQEMMTHGKDISFNDWSKDEGLKHGNTEITEWAQHEDESHDARYGAETFEADRYWDEPTDSFRETFGPTVEVREFPKSSSVYKNGKVVKKYSGDGHMIKSRSWAEGLRDDNFNAEGNSNNKWIFGALIVGLSIPVLSTLLNSGKDN
tara:strand:+ start:2502 stop:3800 length:1299 start_codon:yes stop_codon:yes gene_type:complete